MTRLQAADPATTPEDVSTFLAQFPPDEMFTMLTHSPSTVKPFIGLAQALYTSLDLPIRARELAILTLADAVRGEFVFAQHVAISETVGIDEKLRRAIRDHDHQNPALSDYDRVIVRFVAEFVTAEPVSDATFSALRRFLSEREVVELLHVCGYYWTLSRLCTVLQVDLTQLYAEVSVEGFSAAGAGGSTASDGTA
jgi:alkylhydroperoxidase family enzyme